MADFSQGQALVIGVGRYADQRYDAPAAANDARALHTAMLDPQVAGYPAGQAELLLDREATRAAMREALRRLADRATPESVVLISFTGHGALGDDGLYYLASTDARFSSSERIAAGSGLSVADLARALEQIAAERLLLIVNACLSGQVGQRIGAVLPDLQSGQILTSGKGRAILTASRPDQLSYFAQGQERSYFGQAMLDGLRGGGPASQAAGYVGLFELYERAYQQTRDAVRRRLGQEQEPVLTLLQGVGPFPVARYPAARGQPGEAALATTPPAGTAVRVVERDTITASGPGAVAIKAEADASVTVDNSRSDNRLISFDGAQIMGGVTIGDLVQGDKISTSYHYGGAPATGDAAEPLDPLARLPILRARVAAARNVDEDERDSAALKLDQALKALQGGDGARAARRIAEAIATLRAMENGYVNSIVRKLEQVAAAIAG